MKKESIKSLTKKGWSQKKIAKTLGIRKMKVVTYQKAHKIGKRAPEGGAKAFWKDVKSIKELYGISRKKAKTKVKYSPKWAKKRQARLKGISLQKDIYAEKWQAIKAGEIDEDWWESEEGEDLMEAAGYD